MFFFFFQAEDGIRDRDVTGVQTCALPISTARQVGHAHEPTARGGHVQGIASPRAVAKRRGQHGHSRIGLLLGSRNGRVADVRLLRGGGRALSASFRSRRRGACRRVSRRRRRRLHHGRVHPNCRARCESRMIRLRAVVFVATIAVATLALTRQPVAQPAAAPGGRETLVMPFENSQSEPRLHWLGEASAVLLGDYLPAFGAATIPRDSRVDAFDRLQLPPAASLSHATVIKLTQAVGASSVVIGSYQLAGEHLTVHAHLIRIDSGQLLPEVTERGPLTELLSIYERVARRLQDVAAPLPPLFSGTVLGSPQALEQYVKGLHAETPPTKRKYLEQAAKLAPRD